MWDVFVAFPMEPFSHIILHWRSITFHVCITNVKKFNQVLLKIAVKTNFIEGSIKHWYSRYHCSYVLLSQMHQCMRKIRSYESYHQVSELLEPWIILLMSQYVMKNWKLHKMAYLYPKWKISFQWIGYSQVINKIDTALISVCYEVWRRRNLV